ncbi:MAG: cellulase family glycosylhydrolase [Desulfuromonadales bacterium]
MVLGISASRLFSVLLFVTSIVTGPLAVDASAAANSKVLTPGRAIATWPSGIPAGEKRPVVVFLPGWDGAGNVDAAVSAQNTNLVNAGYVTLAIGFDDTGGWTSNIDVKSKEGLNLLCADASIPANCKAIVIDGESYGGAQNYWVMEYLRSNGYSGANGTAKALGFVSEDAGYSAPGNITDYNTGAFTRTGLADTASYSVAMIENLGDTSFPVDDCTWGNCGARTLSNAHQARGDGNVFSICPAGGDHGTRGYADWNTWVVSAIKTMIHTTSGIPTFTGYANPTLPVSNACVTAAVLPGLSVSGANIIANGQPVQLHGVNMVDPFFARDPAYYPMYTTANYATLANDWKAKIVRISVYPTKWKNMNSATLLAGLAQEVNAALASGMYVVISYHVIGWPDGYYPAPFDAGNPADTYDSSMVVARSFWTQMAKSYGADRRIIFDLWNEPVHDAADWDAADPNPYWPELKLAYESIIQTVRNNGGQNIVLATGNRWASWLVGIKDNPLTDPNVVYAYHKYSVNGYNTAAEWNKDTGGLVGVKPVLVTEWGYEDSDVLNPTWPGSQSSYGTPFTQWMDSNKLGNLAWSYHYDNPPALLKKDGSLTMYGAFVKNYFNPIAATATPSITWRHQGDGKAYGMTTNGSSITGGAQFYQEANAAWLIVGQGDFDGDGIRDFVWWNSSTGQVYVMLMASPTAVKSGAVIYTESNINWKIVATGDINGDGRSDLIWWNKLTGQVYAMLLNGTSLAGGALIYAEPNTAWKIVAAADFDGNGKTELLWWNSTTGQVALGQTNGTSASTAGIVYTESNTDWRIAGAGDLDGDGKADIIWHNRTTGQVYGMQTNGSSVTGGAMMYTEPNTQWEIVSVGNYNSDSKADLLWWNQQTGQVYLMPMNGLSAAAGGTLLYTEPDLTWKIQSETEWRDNLYGKGVTTTTK